MKKKTVIPKKKRGPPATGKGEPVVVRMHPPQLKAIDDWIAQQEPPFPSRPEAVRRLVEIGLGQNKPVGKPSAKSIGRAKQLAAKVINGLVDPAAPAEEAANRKRRLLKGPEEFREARHDQLKG